MVTPRIDPTILSASDGRRVWLRVGTLLDGTGSQPLRLAHVVYDEKTILFVGESPPPADLLAPTQRQPDADLPDYTLLPGLIEAHAHFFLEGGELDPQRRAAWLKQTPEVQLHAARQRLEKLVRLGVVAVRDAGDKQGVGLAISQLYRDRGNRGQIMPYVDSPGAAIHKKSRYGSHIAEPMEDFDSPHACVEARIKAGADRIKLIPTGIVNFQQDRVAAEPQMTTAEIAAFVAAAKSFGKQTFAHASGDTGIDRAIEGGVDSIEHGYYVRDDQLAKMRDRQVAWVPTFAPVQAQLDHSERLGWDADVLSNLRRILDRHAASLVKAHEIGVQIIAGSDAGAFGVPHGLGLLFELELMERAGLPPLAVINSATGTPSNRLAFRDKFGQIKPGYQSRFILSRHSPVECISNLRKDKIVVFDGTALDGRESLDPTGL